MNRPIRIAAVTAGLLVAGAIAGALAADAALLLALGLKDGELALAGEALGFVAVVGALFGGVLLPITAWLFLRRVPLGLALLGTVIGTVIGGSLGWIVRYGGNEINGGVMGACAGFACAALLLRLRASAPRERYAVSTRG